MRGLTEAGKRIDVRRSWWLRQAYTATAVGAVVAGIVLLMATPASAAFGIQAFDGGVFTQDESAYTKAGGHPDHATTIFELNSTIDSTGVVVPDGGTLKDVDVDLPPGFVGNPAAVPTCPMGVFLSDPAVNNCPESTQVGVAQLKIAFKIPPILDVFFPRTVPGGVSVYNLEPAPGVAASFGFISAGVPIFFDASVTPQDGYHVKVSVLNASQSLAVRGTSVTLWGVPGDHSHDVNRVCQGTNTGGCSAEAAPTAFISNPTFCPPSGEGLETRLAIDPWTNPGVFAQASFVSHNPPGFTTLDAVAPPLPVSERGSIQGPTECAFPPFKPSMDVVPDVSAPDAPTGLSVDLRFPQEGLANPVGLATAHLRRAQVVLPEGLTISPSAADGLAACTDAQIGVGNDNPVTCPAASKIGRVTATTPLLHEQLEGAVYVGSQKSDDPDSGRMFRIFLVLANEQRGLLVKLEGQVRLRGNDATGEGLVETTFENNPQVPVSTISLRLKTGARAPLATPIKCGEHTVTAQLTSWSGQIANLDDTFNIACPPDLGGFSPFFTAGAIDPAGGAFSPLIVRINRSDRQQFIRGVTIDTPVGLLAKLRGVPLCAEVDAAAGSCPAETRIGTAIVAAGPGQNPFYIRGPVALTESYRGAPYGLSVAIRAVAGPFDLGTVVVRQAIFVDPADAHLTVISDPVPVVVKGIPIRLRSVNVDVDRPKFTRNPTSCAGKQATATFTAIQGATSRQTTRFQASNCSALSFKPRLALALKGKRQMTDGKHPGLTATLTQSPGQAGIKAVKVALPLSLALDPANAASDTLCEFEEGQKTNPACPESSVIGKAKAISPLLNRALTGNAYFVKNIRIDKTTGRRIRTLPTLLIALRGEVALNLRARTSIKDNKLVSTFSTVPDAPVSRFVLALRGGKRGILVVNGNVCSRNRTAATRVTAQNRKQTVHGTAIKAPCGQR